VRRVFKNVKVQPYEPGKEVAPDVTSIAAYGHTPGHTAFAVASGSQSMLVLSDTTNHPWLFLRNPEWQAAFDMDGAMAVDTRRRLLDQAAVDKMLVQGYHFTFPACGYVTKSGAYYDLVPVMWQPAI
jgi:glyoxylase-like metal-dependent hydrolase (beta-lactamase superfamily II)